MLMRHQRADPRPAWQAQRECFVFELIGPMKTRFALFVVSGLIVGGCATTQTTTEAAPRASWESALRNGISMDGHEVSMCGWLDAEFEVCTLARSPYGDPAFDVVTQIWLSPKSDVCALENVTAHPTKGWVDVTGTFQFSGDPDKGFGRSGMFRYAIGNAEMKMREEPCDSSSPNPAQ